VRLGEHQISTTVDCRKHKGRDLCAPAVEDFQHEHIHLHENYKHTEIGHDDIALIKLKGSVSVKLHIKPICLPITQELQEEPKTLPQFKVTGWGKTESAEYSDSLMESNVPKVPRENCERAYNKEYDSSIICAGDTLGDSCNGDSGGPLTDVAYFHQRQRFILYGIVSGGSHRCGNAAPGVYTNVSKFLSWIAAKMAES
ncbi:CG30082, partial [Drosophila busckii]